LLLCGDIQANPGPVQYPCGVCKQSVRQNQQALLCDGCDDWFHISCARVSIREYESYSSQGSFPWHCPLCLFHVLPNCDVLSCDGSFNADMSLSKESAHLEPSIMESLNIGGGVQVIHHNVQGLSPKLLCEVNQWLHACFGSPTVFCCTETWIA